jgi:hypothetical protein
MARWVPEPFFGWSQGRLTAGDMIAEAALSAQPKAAKPAKGAPRFGKIKE